ncbi:MAG: SAM-dependent methyltransferase [Alphaproteobacteria bacterium]|nr:SAM-dependent methyltransferase [Alphaproteobacteria bacterium]
MTGLAARLAARIARDGPISIADYMQACLHDPDDGYYAAHPRLGADGDFITAPHVSQMFGELLGLWAADVWAGLGRPARLRLVEMGPGDGTLMADLRRAARAAPGFLEAAEIWLVETSAPLAARQRQVLGEAGISWAASLEAVPGGAPLILIANELLDCLPIRQAVAGLEGWRERLVGCDPEGRLCFMHGAAPERVLPVAPPGSVIEWSTALEAFGGAVGARLCRDGGAALFLDYGRDTAELGDTLQALRAHRKESPLAHPGAADLTAHVDFPAFAAAARAAGARVSEITRQGDFLWSLGIGLRAQVLAAARPEAAETLSAQTERLIGPRAMGGLFKVVALWRDGPAPPGLIEAVPHG